MRSVPNSRNLFKRAGSQFWYYRAFNPATGRYVEKTTGCVDKHAAEAMPKVAEALRGHRATMFERRQARVASIVFEHAAEYAPGRFTMPDGRTGIATKDRLVFDD